MRLLYIVEADPVFDHLPGFEVVSKFLQISRLLLERAPEPFDEDIVEIAAVCVH